MFEYLPRDSGALFGGMRTLLIWGVVVGCGILPAMPVAAQVGDSELAARVAALEQELTTLRQQPGEVRPASLVTGDCPACARPQRACCCPPPSAGKLTPDITGFFHLDAGWFSQDAANRAILGDINDGLGFRRARGAATGKVADDISYIMEFDFAQFQARLVDVWMQFHKTPVGNVRIGRYRQPFGMSELTSIREIPFLERSQLFGVAPFRQTGIMLFDTALDEQLTWALSGYRFFSDNFGNVYGDDGGYGVAARLTVVPIAWDDDGLVHFGLGYSYNDPARNQIQFVGSEFFVGQNPVLGPGGLSVLPVDGVPPFLNTGPMAAARSNLFNLEGAASWGRLVFQSEIRWASVLLANGTHNTFPGAYAQLRYMLSGEAIPYNWDGGVFGRVKPANPVDCRSGAWGAWEVGARLSYLDLNGMGLPGPGRRMTSLTLGLTWYVAPRVKFQFNSIHADLDDPIQGDSAVQITALRGQIDF